MAETNPIATTWGDLLRQALKDSGAMGIGMLPLNEDLMDASARGQWLLQQWERKRWLIYHLVTLQVLSTGQNFTTVAGLPVPVPYTVGPTGLPNTTPPQISVGAAGVSTRPNRLESAFFRQLTGAPNGPIDYPLRLLQSMEDYNDIRLKPLGTFSLYAFYDPAWPYGMLYVWPWPEAILYSICITVREQLPQAFSLTGNPLAVQLNLPFEYYRALVKNIALEVRPKYGIATPPGDDLKAQARDSLATLRSGNVAIPSLSMPAELTRGGLYDIFSDRQY